VADKNRLRTWETLFAKALQAIDSVRKPTLGPANWSFGGGTVLMRRFRHRYSKDIDLFVPDPQYLGYLDPELNDRIAALTSRHLRAANYVRLYFPEGEVDFIAAAPVTDNPRVTEAILGRNVLVDTSIEIVAKKLKYRASDFTARDIFDFSLVVERESHALRSLAPVLKKCRAAILRRLDSSDRVLRTTFEALDTLEYRPTYDQCIAVLRRALGTSNGRR